MDIFTAFYDVNDIHDKLNGGKTRFDVDYDFSEMSTSMVVRIEKTSEVDIWNTEIPKFSNLPSEIRGSLQDATTKLVAYIENLRNLPAAFFRKYADALEITFRLKSQENFLSWMQSSLVFLLSSYFSENSWKSVPCEVKIELTRTAKVVVFNQIKNVSVIYEFVNKTLSITGFPEEELVKSKNLLAAPVQIDKIKVCDVIKTESVYGGYLFKNDRVTYLNESILDQQTKETADDVLDTVIQKLILLDMADGMQDVVIDDVGIILFFDPVMNPDEIELIMASIKQSYPKARLLETPFMRDCQYWTIDIPIVEDAEREILQAGRIPQSMGGDASPVPMAKEGNNAATPITNDIKIGKLLRSL